MAFVQVSGTDFTLNGRKWVPYGASTYDITNPDHSTATVDSKITAALSMNLNTIRIVNYMWNQSLAWDSEVTWGHVDYILDECRTRNLKLLLDLSDFYLYPETATGEKAQLPSGRQYWYDFVDWLFARQNTINGRYYKDDDTICIIAISGEIPATAPRDGFVLRDFFSDVSARIKATGAQQIVHAGGQAPYILTSSDHSTLFEVQQDMLSIPTIDCVSVHPYDTQADKENWFPKNEAYSIEKQKPWFIEEFGFNQSSSGQTDVVRSAHMRFVYNIGFKYGAAGFLFWNIDNGVGSGYGINAGTPLVADMVRRYSKYTRYSPRIPVDSSNPTVISLPLR